VRVVVASSALIPLARVGRLDLITTMFENVRTTGDVRDVALAEGKRGTASLSSFLDDVAICAVPNDAEDVASLEGITVADASVISLAEDGEEVLLANDKGLIEVARTHGVDCWWVTTLLLKCAKDGVLTATEATDVLYDLVDAGMNLSPKVYSQVQQKLEEFGE